MTEPGPSRRTATVPFDGQSHAQPPQEPPDGAAAHARRAERSLLDAIAGGELDDHLGAIALAVDARTRLLHTIDSNQRLATLCVGGRARIGQRVSPRYLAGLDGTIVELNDRAAIVRLDFPVGRFESGRVRCPHRCTPRPRDRGRAFA